eukprot:448548-Karenia_brevis.AAC.1
MPSPTRLLISHLTWFASRKQHHLLLLASLAAPVISPRSAVNLWVTWARQIAAADLGTVAF